MNKKELTRLAMIGATAGIILSQAAFAETAGIPAKATLLSAGCAKCAAATADKEKNDQPKKIQNGEELVNKLNANGKEIYEKLDQQHRDLALKLANQDCNGKNECKGMGGCNSAEKSGKNECKGMSKCNAFIKDPNFAVKVAAQKMLEKRANATK
jgi:hypothetical protein